METDDRMQQIEESPAAVEPETGNDGERGESLALIREDTQLISPKDVMALRCVSEITAWMIENKSSSIAAACKATEWPRWYYYQVARENDYVQAHVANQMQALGVAEHELLAANWLGVVRNQIDIAAGSDDKRTATAAARFLANRWESLREQLAEEDAAATGKKTRAEQLLEELLSHGGGKVTTTVEVEPAAITVN